MNDLYDMSDEELEKAFKEVRATEDIQSATLDNSTEQSTTQHEVDDVQEHTSSNDAGGADVGQLEGNQDPNQNEGEADNSDQATKQSAQDMQQPQTMQTRRVKALGQEFEFSEQEMIEKFPQAFSQAMDYTKKMQAIKPYRKIVDAIQQEGLSQDDVNLAIDALKGNKDAMAVLMKRNNLDALDIDTEKAESYRPSDYGRHESVIAITDVVNEIKDDPEYPRTFKVLNDQWDSNSWDAISKNPKMIKGLHTDIKSGLFDVLAPVAEKMKVYDEWNGVSKKSDLQYYWAAADQYREYQYMQSQQAQQHASVQSQQQQVQQVKQQSANRQAAQQQASVRKAAAPTSASINGNGKKGPVNYLEMSDDEFEQIYREQMSRA
jgi:hypothetical protein